MEWDGSRGEAQSQNVPVCADLETKAFFHHMLMGGTKTISVVIIGIYDPKFPHEAYDEKLRNFLYSHKLRDIWVQQYRQKGLICILSSARMWQYCSGNQMQFCPLNFNRDRP